MTIYRRDEILEGGGGVIIYKLDEATWPPLGSGDRASNFAAFARR